MLLFLDSLNPPYNNRAKYKKMCFFQFVRLKYGDEAKWNVTANKARLANRLACGFSVLKWPGEISGR